MGTCFSFCLDFSSCWLLLNWVLNSKVLNSKVLNDRTKARNSLSFSFQHSILLVTLWNIQFSNHKFNKNKLLSNFLILNHSLKITWILQINFKFSQYFFQYLLLNSLIYRILPLESSYLSIVPTLSSFYKTIPIYYNFTMFWIVTQAILIFRITKCIF